MVHGKPSTGGTLYVIFQEKVKPVLLKSYKVICMHFATAFSYDIFFHALENEELSQLTFVLNQAFKAGEANLIVPPVLRA